MIKSENTNNSTDTAKKLDDEVPILKAIQENDNNTKILIEKEKNKSTTFTNTRPTPLVMSRHGTAVF